MATAGKSSKDVTLSFGVETVGVESLQALIEHLRALAKQGGEGAQDMARLADELEHLSQQKAAVDTLQALIDKSRGLEEAQAGAREKAERLEQGLENLKQAAQSATEKERGLRAELDATNEAKARARLAIRELAQGYKETGQKSADYKQQMKGLSRTILETDKRIIELKNAWRQSREELQAANAAQKAATKATADAGTASRSAQQAVQQHRQAMQDASGQARQLGADTNNLSLTQERVNAGFAHGTEAAQKFERQLAEIIRQEQLAVKDAKAFADALRLLDVKTVAELEREIQATRDAMQLLADSGELTGGELKNAMHAGELAIQKLEMELRQAAEGTKAFDAAIRLLDVKPVEAIEREIGEVNKALQTLIDSGRLSGDELNAAMSKGEAQIAQLEREIAKATGALDDFGKNTALEEKHQQAKKLAEGAEYVQWWTQALAGAADAEKELAEQNAFEEKHRQAKKLVQDAEYVDWWKKALEEAAAQEKELAETRLWEQKLADAQKAREVAETVKMYAGLFDEIEAKKRAAIQATKDFNDAFRRLDATPVKDIHHEIEATRNAMQLLAQSGQLTGRELAVAMQQGEAKIKDLEREMRKATDSLTLADKAASLFKNSLGQIAAGNLIADGIGVLIGKIKGMGAEFFDANLALERLRRTMTQVTGSAEGAAQKIAFLRDVASTAGTSVSAITDSFIRFQASAMAAGMAGEEVDAVFKAVTVSATRMGVSSDRVGLALDALGQMASKGVISMEELRQQLGDSLPGALSTAAKGLGVTEAELVKLVETGQLTAKKFFPAFKKGLEETFGDSSEKVQGLAESMNRLRNKLTELYQSAIDSGPMKTLATSIELVTNHFEALTTGVWTLGKAFIGLKLGEFVSHLVSLGTQAKAAATGLAAKTAATAADTTATIANTTAHVANSAARGANALAVAAQGTATTVATAATGLMTGGMGLLSTALAGARLGFTRLLAAMGPIGITLAAITALIGPLMDGFKALLGWVTGYTKATKELEAQEEAFAKQQKKRTEERKAAINEQVQALEKQSRKLEEVTAAAKGEEAVMQKAVETQKARAQLMERTIALYGDERQAAQMSLDVAQGNLKVMVEQEAVRQRFIAALEAEIAMKERILEIDKTQGSRFVENLDKLKQLLAVKKEEHAAMQVTVEDLKLEAVERKIAVAALEDNSAKLHEYREAMRLAREEFEKQLHLNRQGVDNAKELADAQLTLTEATALHADALKDANEKMQAQMAVEKEATNLKKVGLEVQKSAHEQMAATARANGVLAQATHHEIEAKKIQIQITRLLIEAKLKEADMLQKVVEEERRSLQSSGQLTEAKKLELQARELKIKAMKAEAEGEKTIIRAIEDEIQRLHGNTEAQYQNSAAREHNANATREQTSALEEKIATLEKEIELEERAAALERKRRGVDEDGFSTNNKGGKVTAYGDITEFEVYKSAKDAGLSEEDALALSRQKFKSSTAPDLRGGFVHQSSESKAYEAIRKMVMQRAQEKTAAENKESKQKAQQETRERTKPKDSGAGTNVTINIPGRPRRILQVASQQDALTLAGAIRDLENAQGVAA